MKKFHPTEPFYDLSTYPGRLRHFYSVTNPLTLLTTREQMTDAQNLLEQYDKGTLPELTTDEQLWNARHIVDSCIHPDTKEPVAPMLRFSAFGLVNTAIVPFMLAPSTIASPFRTVFGHWLNQSYNAAVNYSNRNASSPISNQTLVQAYTGAVVSSCSIGLGATALTRRMGSSGFGALLVRASLPFIALVAAGCANVLLIRKTELQEGIMLRDEDGNEYGKSLQAGKIGLGKCCLARLIWNAPIMLCMPLILSRVTMLPIVARGGNSRKLLVENIAYIGSIFAFVPPGLAAFPQIDRLEASQLEEKYQNIISPTTNRPITSFLYNRGL
eukprot:CAMPEP_0201507046 /NCGR_PEP_ID=MMETSP0161_2-20130828/845_1 /ASSEMBLY_ACC=CAM_ASM_000251 /TAXON_ID=180227 /ORGANISM="Neoparamoeba aestuarina, Strain SoJaBio B1-5/56/2" /LENGTH=327 /DNA_ID=CAMNT_0047901317 /DNA_START=18 /DNA_END=1001 /DNA_ORIENTATION=+